MSEVELEPLLQRADALYSAGRFDEAIPTYLQVVRLAPDHLPAYEPLAFSYAKLGLFNEANEWLRERQSRSDQAAFNDCMLADVAARRGDLAAAQLHKDRLLSRLGDEPPWSLMACAAEIETRLGEYAPAKRRLEEAVAQLRREGKPLHGLSFLAFFALREGDVERANALLAEHDVLARERLARGESVATMHFDLAAIDALRGRPERAVAHLKEALRVGGWGEYWGDYHYLRADPILARLHGHGDFERLIAEIKAGAERMRERLLSGTHP